MKRKSPMLDGIEQIEAEVDRLFDEVIPPRRWLPLRHIRVWRPPTDVYETHENVVIKMSVPGIRKADVRVSFDGEEIIISGYRTASHDAHVMAYHQMEIRNGWFERRVVIRKPINSEAATADYRDGFLWIRVPKGRGVARRVITIRPGS